MLLDVSKALAAQGEEISFTTAQDFTPAEWDGEPLRFLMPVTVGGVYVAMKDSVWIRARVSTRVGIACANCLEPAQCDVSAKLDACFVRQPDPEDPDLFTFEGHSLCLDDAALGALWLEMPLRILCGPDCKGLCPTCGVNRNQTECACQKEASANPFSALATLLNQDEEV